MGLENPSPVQPVAYHMVNRRYSEFLNLQTRLEEKTDLRKLIKGTWHFLWINWRLLFGDLWSLVDLHWLESGTDYFRCERSKENIPRHAIWKHGQWQDRGQEGAPGDLPEGWWTFHSCILTLFLKIHCDIDICSFWSSLIWSSQQLCAIPEIANSEEMQEFLALNTDARIAFVKKPFLVSRIDKVSSCTW